MIKKVKVGISRIRPIGSINQSYVEYNGKYYDRYGREENGKKISASSINIIYGEKLYRGSFKLSFKKFPFEQLEVEIPENMMEMINSKNPNLALGDTLFKNYLLENYEKDKNTSK